MAVVIYVAYIFRFVDFADTLFFVLRKKTGHVSTLQVTHHFVMPLFGWILVAYAPGGQESFGGILNAVVHSVMYSYYFLAALGPKYRKYLWWKRYLTTMQMVQFVMILVKSAANATGVTSCGEAWEISVILCFLMVLFLVLFTQFYINEYVSKTRKSS